MRLRPPAQRGQRWPKGRLWRHWRILRLWRLCSSLALGPLPWAPAGAAACGAELPPGSRWTIESPVLQLVFTPRPAPLQTGRHFSLEIAVCALDAALLPASLRVDAEMPAHRHGMNYAADVTALGGGRFRADGLLLHMPGRWRFVFELTSVSGQRSLLSRDLEIE